MVKYLYFVNRGIKFFLKSRGCWKVVISGSTLISKGNWKLSSVCDISMSGINGLHAQQLRQSSLRSTVKVENKRTTLYLQWTVYSSLLFWCLCSSSMCPDVFVGKNCVWEQNKLIIYEEFPLALFLKLITVLPSVSPLAVFPRLLSDLGIRGVFGNQAQSISGDEKVWRSVSLHTLRHNKDANHWFQSQLDLLYGNASNTVSAATAS